MQQYFLPVAVWLYLLATLVSSVHGWVVCPIHGSSIHAASATTIKTTTTTTRFNLGDALGLDYEEPVFRPPAEWRSLILQVTIGCSWNKCTFCEMYQDKGFRAKPLAELEQELQHIVQVGGASHVRDVFLADGDAMTLPVPKLLKILTLIHQYLPNVRRISSYCLPRNIRYTSVEDLKKLRALGLSLVYVGCESGNDQVLQAVNKGETYASSFDALNKLQQAGIKRSVMILLGLGGQTHSQSHAAASAKLVSATEPEYLSVLTTSFPRGQERIQKGYQNLLPSPTTTTAATTTTTTTTTTTVDSSSHAFIPLNARESLMELYDFLSQIEMKGNHTIFRSDHASNYLVLKGRLGRDQARLLEELKTVLDASPAMDPYLLRPEWARGL